MFIHALSDTQKKAFFDLANQMILADEEVSYLNRLYWEAGLIERRGPGDDGEEAALEAFTDDRAAQLICVAELLTIAIIDGKYHHAENIAGAIVGMKTLIG